MAKTPTKKTTAKAAPKKTVRKITAKATPAKKTPMRTATAKKSARPTTLKKSVPVRKTTTPTKLTPQANSKLDFTEFLSVYEDMKEDIADSIGDIVEEALSGAKIASAKAKMTSTQTNALSSIDDKLFTMSDDIDYIRSKIEDFVSQKPKKNTKKEREKKEDLTDSLVSALVKLSKKKVLKNRVHNVVHDTLGLGSASPAGTLSKKPSRRLRGKRRGEEYNWKFIDEEYQPGTAAYSTGSTVGWKARQITDKMKRQKIKARETEATPDSIESPSAQEIIKKSKERQKQFDFNTNEGWKKPTSAAATGDGSWVDDALEATGAAVAAKYAWSKIKGVGRGIGSVARSTARGVGSVAKGIGSAARGIGSSPKATATARQGLKLVPKSTAIGDVSSSRGIGGAAKSTVRQGLKLVPKSTAIGGAAKSAARGIGGKGAGKIFMVYSLMDALDNAVTSVSLYHKAKKKYGDDVIQKARAMFKPWYEDGDDEGYAQQYLSYLRGTDKKEFDRISKLVAQNETQTSSAIRKKYGDDVLQKARDTFQPWYKKRFSLDTEDENDSEYVQKYLKNPKQDQFKSVNANRPSSGPSTREPLKLKGISQKKTPKLAGMTDTPSLINGKEELKNLKRLRKIPKTKLIQQLIYLLGELAKIQDKIKKTIENSMMPEMLDAVLMPLKMKESNLIEEIMALKRKMNLPTSSNNLGGGASSDGLKGSAGNDQLSGIPRAVTGSLLPDMQSNLFAQRFRGVDSPSGTYMPQTASLGPIGGTGFERSGGWKGSDGSSSSSSSSSSAADTSPQTLASGTIDSSSMTPAQVSAFKQFGITENMKPQGGFLSPKAEFSGQMPDTVKTGGGFKHDNTNAAKVMNTLMKKGLTREQAEDLTANFMQESWQKLNTKAVGDKAQGLNSFGIGQWNRERFQNLKKFAEKQGKPIDDIELQAEFALHEMETTHKKAGDQFKAAKTSEERYRILRDKYEVGIHNNKAFSDAKSLLKKGTYSTEGENTESFTAPKMNSGAKGKGGRGEDAYYEMRATSEPKAIVHPPENAGAQSPAATTPTPVKASPPSPVIGSEGVPPSYRKAIQKAKNQERTVEPATNGQGITSPYFV